MKILFLRVSANFNCSVQFSMDLIFTILRKQLLFVVEFLINLLWNVYLLLRTFNKFQLFFYFFRHFSQLYTANRSQFSFRTLRTASRNPHTSVPWWLCSGTCSWWKIPLHLRNRFNILGVIASEFLCCF